MPQLLKTAYIVYVCIAMGLTWVRVCVCVTVRVLLVVCVEIWGYRERMAKNE